MKFKNVAITGEPASGKTQLCEAILHKAGIVTRLNLVAKGQSVFDSQNDEKERQLSIDMALGYFEKDGVKVNIIDTPGYADFIGEVIAGIFASDFVLILLDGEKPISAAAQKFFALAKKYGKPAAFFINAMAKDAAAFDARFSEIKDRVTINAAPFYIAGKSGKIDILNDDGDSPYKETLMEAIASSDDALLEKYLTEGSITKEDIAAPLMKGIASGKIVPVLSGDALTEDGVDNLMDFFLKYVPDISRDASKPALAQIFKISAQGHTGEVAYAKILEGKFSQGTNIYNVSRNSSFRLTQINAVQGADKQTVTEAVAGDIVGFVKLKDVYTGDTVSESKSAEPEKFAEFPQPVYSVSVKSKTPGAEEKVATSLASIRKENPIIRFGFNSETKEMVLSGMGNIQMDILAKRILSNFNTEIELSPPRIPYKETIGIPADAEGKHKKQSGGHGQFGRCVLKYEPLERGAGFEFVNKIVGGAIPGNYIPAIEKGLIAALEKGVVAGYPMVDIKATVYDGSYHEVDSSNLSFEIAASISLKNAMDKARPIVLEPIMFLEITFPDEFTGAISGDMTSRRGRIINFEKNGVMQVIKAEAPQSEVTAYVNELRSMTKGQGEFTMKFSHYDPAPANIMNALVEKHSKEQAEGR
ncbi:elongation factor G [bacterium]|nr:elongation factor G [bacterium]MBU3955491.1 elongation factor G [bacterium]MBU4134287.1 elongation factor G [bacterium]